MLKNSLPLSLLCCESWMLVKENVSFYWSPCLCPFCIHEVTGSSWIEEVFRVERDTNITNKQKKIGNSMKYSVICIATTVLSLSFVLPVKLAAYYHFAKVNMQLRTTFFYFKISFACSLLLHWQKAWSYFWEGLTSVI